MISNKNRALIDDRSYEFPDHDVAVAEFLRHSPQFFSRNPELLLELEVPHQERGATSLVERKLSLQREQCNDLRGRLTEIVDVAHQNDHLAELLHDLSIGLISASSLVDVFRFTHDILTSRLGCEDARFIVIRNEIVDACMQDTPDSMVSFRELEFARSLRELHTRRPVYCGHASAHRIQQFFPNSDLQIRSIAVIRLSQIAYSETVEMGYLALASESKKRFAPHMGTEFLNRFGALLSARLAVFYN